MSISRQPSNQPFVEISFAGDKARYITPSWDELDHLTLQIAAAVQHAAINLDLVVALAKGAWPMSRSFVGYSGIRELASLGVKFYQGVDSRLRQPEIYQELPSSVVIKNKDILIFDDVADTGESLVFTKNYLLDKGAKSVKTATILLKPWSVITPDFYGATTDAWIIFPCERKEMVDLLGQNWREQGIAQEEITKRYQQLGFMEVVKHVG